MEQRAYEESGAMDMKAWFAHFLRGWKWVILIMLFAGVIGAGIAHEKNKKLSAETKEEKEITYEEQMEGVLSRLSATQISKINGLYGQYAENVKEREFLTKSHQNMYIMQLDPSECAVSITQYSVESSAVDVGLMLTNLTLSEDRTSGIREILGADENAGLDNVVRLTRDISANTGTGAAEENNYNSVVTLQIAAHTMDETDAVRKLVQEQADETLAEVRRVYKDFTVAEVGTTYSTTASTIVANLQYDLVNRLNTASNQFVALENTQIKNLSGDEKLYFDLLMSPGTVVVEETEEDDEDAAEAPAVATRASTRVYGAAGVLIGLLVALILDLIIYAAGGHVLKTADTIAGVPTVRLDERLRKTKDPLKKASIRMEDPDAERAADLETQMEIVISRIRHLSGDDGTRRIFLYAGSNGELVKKAADILGKRAPEVAFSEGVPGADGEKMTEFLESDGIVVFASAARTKSKEVSGIARMSADSGKPVLCTVLCYDK